MNFKNLLLGIAIGDAFGAGIELKDRNWIKENVDFTKYLTASPLVQTDLKFVVGNYTDDTEMTIGLIKALLDQRKFSEDLLIEKWKHEYDEFKATTGFPRGHGSIKSFFEGKKTLVEVKAAQANREFPGNAPPMRAIPLGFTGDNLIEFATINATATHPHPKGIAASILVAKAAEFLLLENGDKTKLIAQTKNFVKDVDNETVEYLKKIDKLNPNSASIEDLCGKQPIFKWKIEGLPCSSMHTAGTALFILKHFEEPFEILKQSILIGGDVDSLAAITVGIAAGKHGLKSLPDFLLDGLNEREYIEHAAEMLECYHQQS